MPKFYGIDESGCEKMVIAACVSDDPRSIRKYRHLPKKGVEAREREYGFRYTTLVRGDMPAATWHDQRCARITFLLEDIGESDFVIIDAFTDCSYIKRRLLRGVYELTDMELPRSHIICEPHADEHYPIVNSADAHANVIWNENDGFRKAADSELFVPDGRLQIAFV
jgi:hypothetical protein